MNRKSKDYFFLFYYLGAQNVTTEAQRYPSFSLFVYFLLAAKPLQDSSGTSNVSLKSNVKAV